MTFFDAVKATMEKGTSFGAPCPLENELAKMPSSTPSPPSRWSVSPTLEPRRAWACSASVRAYTSREKVIKFEGCYHGHADSFLVQAGSGVATLGLPDFPWRARLAPPRPPYCAQYNDLESVKAIFDENKDEIAAVILEPVVGNSGFIKPDKEFLQAHARAHHRERSPPASSTRS